MLRYLRENTGNWIIKIFLGIIVLVFVFLGVGSMGSKRNNTVASVNDEPITIKEFQEAYRNIVNRMRERFGENLNDDLLKALNVKQQALNTLIEQKLVTSEADKLKIIVSDKELQDSLLSMKAFHKNGVFDVDQYKKVLGLNSMNPEIFEDLQRRALRQQKVRDMVLSSITVSDLEAEKWYVFENTRTAVDYIMIDPDSFKDIHPSQEQIAKMYDENKDQYKSDPKLKAVYLKFSPQDFKSKVSITDAQISDFYEQNLDRFTTPERVEASHILIKTDEKAEPEAVEAARKIADKVYEKAAKGEDFAKLAKEFSQGPSKDNGGYLGVFDRKSMVKPFGDKAFTMKANEIGKPVKTMFGWHVIKVLARLDASVETLAQASEKIRQELGQQEMQNMAYYQAGEAFDSVVDGDDFEQVALVTNRKVMATGSFTQSGDGLDFEHGDEFAKESFGLAKDEISDVKQFGNDYYLIRVVEKTEPELIPFETIKDKIVLDLTKKLQKQAARKAADELAQKAKNIESLEQLAKQNNLELASTDFFKRDEPVKGIGSSQEFSKAAFGLSRENKIHPQVLETNQGFFILGFKDQQLPSATDVEKNLKNVKKQLAWTKQGQYYQSWIQELKNKNTIEIDPKFIN